MNILLARSLARPFARLRSDRNSSALSRLPRDSSSGLAILLAAAYLPAASPPAVKETRTKEGSGNELAGRANTRGQCMLINPSDEFKSRDAVLSRPPPHLISPQLVLLLLGSALQRSGALRSWILRVATILRPPLRLKCITPDDLLTHFASRHCELRGFRRDRYR